ncbi:MAG: WG repeat-containing protein, partial [Bacteroidota bacterium]
MKNVIRFWMLFAAILFVQSVWAQSEVQVSGLKADEVWPVVRYVVKESNLGVASQDPQAGVLVTAPKEYTTAMARFRARVVFTYKNDNLVVSMKDKQSATTTGWENSILPSKKADDKLVGGFADAIKAVIANPDQIARLKESVAPAVAATKPATGASAGASAGQGAGLKPEPKKPSVANAIELRFDDADKYTFSEGMCALKKNEMWGFIDTTGKVVIDFTLFKLGNQTPRFSSGIALMAVQESSGMRMPVYIDKKGQQLFKPQKFTAATPFESGIALVEKTNEKTRMRTYSFINKQGQPIPGAIDPGTGRGWSVELNPFHEGVTPLYNNKASAIGFINPQGKWAIPPTTYGNAGDFGDGLAAV